MTNFPKTSKTTKTRTLKERDNDETLGRIRYRKRVQEEKESDQELKHAYRYIEYGVYTRKDGSMYIGIKETSDD